MKSKFVLESVFKEYFVMTKTKSKETLINKIRGRTDGLAAGYLERGWVIANHKLVSFHAAFISSVLSLPAAKLATVAANPDLNVKT